MAENRTEKATPKRREEARKKGQIARSLDLNTALVLGTVLGALALLAPSMLDGFAEVLRRGLAQTATPELAGPDGGGELTSWVLGSAFRLGLPLLLSALVAGIVANVVQNRPRLTPQAAKPQFSRINPLQGFKRIVSKNTAVETGKTLIKLAVVGFTVFHAIWPQLPALVATVGLPPAAILSRVASITFSVGVQVAVALALLALADVVYQRWHHGKQLRMTKEELKQEHKQSDVAPEIRAAIRRKQMQQARKRMMAEVPTADVIVTNPTHFAVALRYDGAKPAPEVVAKGADVIAASIRRLAEEHGVPVMSNPPLARALYREVEVGHQIPEQFFQAVAGVLAFVYRTAAKRRALGAARAA